MKYIIHLSITVIALLIITCITTLVVDPYGLYYAKTHRGFNQQKEGVRSKIRLIKALQLPIIKPQTILLGSSRVMDGINPENPILQEYPPVYNLAVDMNRIHETKVLIIHAIKNAPIKRIIIGLDFFMFNSREQKNIDFDEKLIGRKIHFYDYCGATLVSSTALYDSYKTVSTSFQQPDRLEFYTNGFRPEAFYNLKNYESCHYYTNWIFLTPKKQDTKYYFDFTINESVYEELKSLLIICKNHNIDVKLFINPSHMYLDGEGIHAVKKWDDFKNWKRRICTLASDYSIPLYDFSGYNSVTTEKVRTPMSFYWDSSHYKERVGNWIICRIFNKPSDAPTDFGIKIMPYNIEFQLNKIDEDRNKSLSNGDVSAATIYELNDIFHGAPLNTLTLIAMF